MISSKTLVWGALAGLLVACAPTENPTDTGNQNDVQNNDATTDTGTPDTGNPTQDVVDVTADAANYGTCGQTAVSCVCACGMNATCQNGCLTASACQTCVVQAQAQCCPTEATAFATCVMQAQMASDAGPACTDQACIQSRCATQISAYQSCITTASSTPTCQGYLAVCFGSYPLMCP